MSNAAGLKILIVEDEENLGTTLSEYLSSKNFNCKVAKTAAEANSIFLGPDFNPYVVLMDIGLPDGNGLDLSKAFREHRKNFVLLFLSAQNDPETKFQGLELGADDYIKKPFSQRLLLERIRAVLRRYEAHTSDDDSENIMRRGDLMLDPARHLCCWKSDEINLTVTEFLIVEALARRPSHVKSRDQLIDAAYGENIYVDDRTIDSHIKRLRRKFKAVDVEFAGIDTLYGVGYRYTII